MPRTIDWKTRPAKVPRPGLAPYACEICREKIEDGAAIRQSSDRKKAVHDECVRKEITSKEAKERPKPEGRLDLQRWKGEPEAAHRALLLYAMQHASKRSLRAVGRAQARPEPTIRKWSKRYWWDKRAMDAGSDSDAVRAYRQLYLADFGQTEIPEIAANVIVPLSIARPGASLSGVEEDLRAADNLVNQEIVRRRKADDDLRGKHVRLVDGAIGYVVQQMKAGKIRAALRDIPVLFQARALLSGGESESSGAVLGVETVRVRVARETGRDIIEAVSEDLLELTTIVGALRARKEMANTPDKPKAAAVGDIAPPLRLVSTPEIDDSDDEDEDE